MDLAARSTHSRLEVGKESVMKILGSRALRVWGGIGKGACLLHYSLPTLI